jgi:hypothetical protein
MIKKFSFVLLVLVTLSACNVFKGVEGVNGRNGKVVGGSPSKGLRKGKTKIEKRQKRQYDKVMKKRAKRMGTTKKK